MVCEKYKFEGEEILWQHQFMQNLLRQNDSEVHFANRSYDGFMSLYTVVDGIVVANCVGSDALSAINIVYPFTLVFMAVGLMFSTGSNAIIAKKMGEGKQEEANRLMSGVAITATVISVIIAVLFTIFAEPMYMMFGSNEKFSPTALTTAAL